MPRTRARDQPRPAPDGAEAGRRRTILLGALAIVAVTALAYSGSFDGGFVSDDRTAVAENPHIRGLDWPHLKTIFTSFDDANYMPLKVLSLAVDYQLWGLEPAGYHLTNLLVHLGAALVVQALLLRLGFAPVPAALVALLWAVHPLQVESVAWISERKNVLSGLAFFAAFLWWVRWAERGGAGAYAVMLLLYVVALLSKMNTMVLPAVGLAYAATLQGGVRRRDVVATVPLFALAALVGWYNLAGNPIHGSEWHGGSRIVTWLSSAPVVFRYLRLVVWPTGLMGAYDVPLRDSLAEPAVLLSVLGIAALVALTLVLLARRRPEAFWLLWFAITLAPMLNVLVPFRSLMQDRYLYLALLAPLALAAMLLARVPRADWRRPVAGAAATLAVVWAVLSFRQVETWHSPLTFWQPIGLSYVYSAADPHYTAPDWEERVAFLTAELAARPQNVAARNNLAAHYFEAGKLDEALPLLETAARQAPDHGVVHSNLGRVYLHLGRHEEALAALERATELEPYLVPALINLARVQLLLGDAAGARRSLDTCARIRYSPGAAWAWQRELAYLHQLEAAQAAGADP